MSTTTSKSGKVYHEPDGLNESEYYGIMYEVIELIREKGLTMRQSQKLFCDCADAALSIKL